MLDTLKGLIAALLNSIAAHKWYWAGGASGVVVAAVALVLVFGDFFGPSEGAICQTAYARAKAYGVIPNDATQADVENADGGVKDRHACGASGGGETFTLYADLKCKDLKKDDCVTLYAVERADGLSLYQMRQVPDDGDVAVAGAETGEPADQPGRDAATQGASQAASELTDVEVAKPSAAEGQ